MPLPSRALDPAAPDPILGLTEAFRSDPRESRVNLAVGVYVDETGRTPVLPSVLAAERRILEAAGSRTYLPIEGRAAYGAAVRSLLFPIGHEVTTAGRAVTAQTPGGTGALRVAADFLLQTGNPRTIWLSQPTWPNHPQLFRLAGMDVRTYPYLDATGRRLDADAMLATLRTAEPGDVVLFHAACHNPTGIDPDAATWRAIGNVAVERDLLPIVDFAYHGFGDGIREDAASIAILAEAGLEFLVCSSFSKNFALYAERVGALTIVARDAERAEAALTHVRIAIRANYSNPPAHGAQIVETILCDPALRDDWELEVAGMRARIRGNRAAFVDALEASALPGDWEPLRGQRGMFALLGLDQEQVARLRREFGVYVVGAGRVNVAGFTRDNLGRVVTALSAVLAH